MPLITTEIVEALESIKPIADAGETVSGAIHSAILAGGKTTRTIADFLHGTWLGHPLHPVLTDFTIGAWAMGGMFDAASAMTDSDELRSVADHLTLAGTISAVPTAI